MSILAANIGNTKTSLGIFRNRRLIKTFSLDTAKLHKANSVLAKLKVTKVIYASVKPQAERDFIRIVKVKPLKLGRDIRIPITLKVDNPKEVGLDRIADCVAAYERTKNACIVVDCGTAITINFVDRSGTFCGGIIAPGVGTSIWSLHERCALLPLVKITKPRNIIGKNTVDNIKSGVWLSIKGLIELAKSNFGRKAPVIGTGGDAPLFADSFDKVIPNLALEGIAIAYYKNGRL